MADSYRVCLERMKSFEEFMHYSNNMHGIKLMHSKFSNIEYKNTIGYYIYSYTTLVCFVDFDNKKYCINPYKYSTTTSKQVTLIRRAAIKWEYNGFERIMWL